MNSELSRIAEEAKKNVTWPDWESSRNLVDTLLLEKEERQRLTPELITHYLKQLNGSIAPAVYFLLVSKIVEKDMLYEIFVPMFKIGENPLDPVFIRYLVGILLEWNLFTKAQARHFINALIENSDIEEIYKGEKIIAETAAFPDAFIDEPPEDDYTLKTDFGDTGEESLPKDSFRIIKWPNKEEAEEVAVNMLYGWSDTFYDNVNSYLWDRW